MSHDYDLSHVETYKATNIIHIQRLNHNRCDIIFDIQIPKTSQTTNYCVSITHTFCQPYCHETAIDPHSV